MVADRRAGGSEGSDLVVDKLSTGRSLSTDYLFSMLNYTISHKKKPYLRLDVLHPTPWKPYKSTGLSIAVAAPVENKGIAGSEARKPLYLNAFRV